MGDQGRATVEVLSDGSSEHRIGLAGDWRLSKNLSFDPAEVLPDDDRAISFDTSHLGEWDSALISYVFRLHRLAESRQLTLDLSELPDGAARLVRLATTVPEKDTNREDEESELFYDIGVRTLGAFHSTVAMLTFLGEAVIAFGKSVVGRANYRQVDLFATIQQTGAMALPIVALISFLVGLILAFVGAVQLQKFGAGIFVADLVAIAMAREMAPIMTAIVMAGRTGAAFAAQLGTMTVNEEIDALKTLGINPMEFLVLPRLVALLLMMPLLCVYANLVGIVGGIVVGVGVLDLTLTQYMDQTREALNLTHISLGLVKACVFGAVVSLAGCLRGIQCGRSAAAVGVATTSAVVTAIVAIIAIDAVFAYVTNVIGI